MVGDGEGEEGGERRRRGGEKNKEIKIVNGRIRKNKGEARRGGRIREWKDKKK